MTPICFGHSSYHPQEGELQGWIYRDIIAVYEQVHKCKILSFNNTCFEIHIKISNAHKIFVIIPVYNEFNIQGIPGGMCQTSGECSLC